MIIKKDSEYNEIHKMNWFQGLCFQTVHLQNGFCCIAMYNIYCSRFKSCLRYHIILWGGDIESNRCLNC
jgi:hypothetical protein